MDLVCPKCGAREWTLLYGRELYDESKVFKALDIAIQCPNDSYELHIWSNARASEAT